METKYSDHQIEIKTKGKEVRKSSYTKERGGGGDAAVSALKGNRCWKMVFSDTLAWPVSPRHWDVAGNSAMWIQNLLWVHPMHGSGKDDVCWWNVPQASAVRSPGVWLGYGHHINFRGLDVWKAVPSAECGTRQMQPRPHSDPVVPGHLESKRKKMET